MKQSYNNNESFVLNILPPSARACALLAKGYYYISYQTNAIYFVGKI